MEKSFDKKSSKNAVEGKVNMVPTSTIALSAMVIPDDREHLVRLVGHLLERMDSVGGNMCNAREGMVRHQYWMALCQKYEVALGKLQELYPDDSHCAAFEKAGNRSLHKRALKMSVPFIVLLVVAILIFVLSLLFSDSRFVQWCIAFLFLFLVVFSAVMLVKTVKGMVQGVSELQKMNQSVNPDLDTDMDIPEETSEKISE